MIGYRMMTEGNLLCHCVHGGPIADPAGQPAPEQPTAVEVEHGIPSGTVARFLGALARTYGACGVLALDGGQVVAHLRFSAHALLALLPSDGVCMQQPDIVAGLAAFDLATLPPKSALRPAALNVDCFHVVGGREPSYRGKGIGTAMLRTAIEWAGENGWKQVRAQACQHIPPIYEWSGMMSVAGYRALGFAAEGRPPHPDLLEGIRHMRDGGHGEAVRRQWEPFAHVSDEEAARLFDVVLDLSEPEGDGHPHGGHA